MRPNKINESKSTGFWMFIAFVFAILAIIGFFMAFSKCADCGDGSIEARYCPDCIEGYEEDCDEWETFERSRIEPEDWDIDCCIDTIFDFDECIDSCIELNKKYNEKGAWCEEACDWRKFVNEEFCRDELNRLPSEEYADKVEKLIDAGCRKPMNIVKFNDTICKSYKLVRKV